MSQIDKSEGHHKMRTKDNELVNRIKLYIEEQIDRRGRMPTIRDIAEALDVGKSSVQRYLEYMVEQGILARGEYGYESIEQSRTERTVSVAKLGYVPCGPLSEEYECIDGYVRLPASFVGNAKKCFLLTASGNSMIDVGINDGDLVLVRQQEEANYNDIVVALVLNAIKEETENVPGLVSENFLNEYVSKLQIEQNGSITVTFMNGSVVSSDMGGEKFSECGKKDYNANRSGSEKESGERRTFDTPYSGILSCVNG